MFFNSINYGLFLPIVFIFYWLVAKKNVKYQNFILLVSSYFFYSCWDWRFLFLLIFSTLLDFFTGIKIANSKTLKSENTWFWLSISINLGFLFVFKYFNFFISSFIDFFEHVGIHLNPMTLNIILPVGISFYTFHGLSYVIDIKKKRIKPELNFVDYSVFVSFFPLLVAGPIERATDLLPQIKSKRHFDYSKLVDGLRQILLGLFKKVVIADQCANFANLIFNNTENYTGITLFIGAFLFAIQIYGDFSGYSDIAQGTARLFGVELLKNFSTPYFSRNIAEFWRRWHISLSTWFRDYVYIPLGGSSGGLWLRCRNILIIFLISGFWHGANWTFIVWGLLNAIYMLPSIIMKSNRANLNCVAQGNIFPSVKELWNMSITLLLAVFAWIFFRAKDINESFYFVKKMIMGLFHKEGYVQAFNFLIWDIGYVLPFLGLCFLVIEWNGREDQHAFEKFLLKKNKVIRWSFYIIISILVIVFSTKEEQFIYFQF